ncbi:GPO family capsid scaffolding protein [Vibrio fluvialis]|uniref:GPO family capsid scaffolding protein n=1 Tax=Vibrio fluvialis TaxID=676 RepID=UPI001EEACAE8|nr:GPO family capsid scaffolding protein [Vibrio fluvialis]MCG6365348.1 GPO family capsid scaffolding protein [Vibrio fluvialis]
MPKTSDWVIVATAGTTVSDGRVISESWINDMAELYDPEEYKALIWPEHYRSAWAVFEGNNWGEVEELKAGKFKDKLRLFAKLAPNHYLLEANKDGQKLFSSIEPEPDYKKEGRCYLLGLAVTDSPASSGTTRLRFSRVQGQFTELECSALEEWDLTPFYNQGNEFSKFFALCKSFFTGEQPNDTNQPQPEDEEPMNQEQFNQVMGAIKDLGTKQGELEEKFNTFSSKQKPEEGGDETTTVETSGDQETGITTEQFNQLSEQLKGIANKQTELATQFNQLKQEGPDGQGPEDEGSTTTVEVI